MPDMSVFNLSCGIRKSNLIGQVEIFDMKTLGGFDIRKNDMPFPSNQMNSTMIGFHLKYFLPFENHIELVGGASRVIAGRNVSQETGFNIGAFYLCSLKKKK